MAGRYFDEEVLRENDPLAQLRGNIKQVGNLYLQKQLQDQEQRKKIQQAVESSVLEAALKNQRLKQGADLSQLDTTQGMKGVLRQLPKMFEREPLSYEDQRRRDFLISGGAIAPSEEELSPYQDMAKQATATKLGAARALPVAGGGFILPGEEDTGGMPTQNITPEVSQSNFVKEKSIPATQELFSGQMAKRMNAYKAMRGSTEPTKMQSITNTKKVIDNITTKTELQELINNRAEYEAEGVDVDKVLETLSYLLK